MTIVELALIEFNFLVPSALPVLFFRLFQEGKKPAKNFSDISGLRINYIKIAFGGIKKKNFLRLLSKKKRVNEPNEDVEIPEK